MTTIVWFRQDLRITDNPALAHAAARGPILPVYILDETPPPAGRPLGGASRWWLHRSLAAMTKALGRMTLLRGNPLEILPKFVRDTGAKGIVWNRCYEPYAVARDKILKAEIAALGVDVQSFNGSLLNEPWTIKTLEGGPFKVYSPYWRACQKVATEQPRPAPAIRLARTKIASDTLDAWALLPKKPDWAQTFASEWEPGEAGAQKRLDAFLTDGLAGYALLRDRPDLPNVSRLSPHLHFGEISPRQVVSAVRLHAELNAKTAQDVEKFVAEIGWREFAHHLLFHFPALPTENFKRAFDAYPWQTNAAHVRAWQRGKTGYPMVDAGMRELWTTGFMHNRVRMIAASFLIKHLRIDWRRGEEWFWDTLLDADQANNAASWQWVAGSGADAAPYFRIFNPMEQGRKFDPKGAYIRRWCPELARLPDAHVHAPFDAPPETLAQAGIILGKDYPRPIVDHATARKAALDGYAATKPPG